MGLPLFITPAEPESTAKSVDKIASATRSPIRRRTRRQPRANVSPGRTDSQRRSFLGELEEIRHRNQVVLDAVHSPDSPPTLISQAALDLEQDRSRIRLRESLGTERQQTPSADNDGLFMPPAVPEPRDYNGLSERFANNARIITEARRMARRHLATDDYGPPSAMPERPRPRHSSILTRGERRPVTDTLENDDAPRQQPFSHAGIDSESAATSRTDYLSFSQVTERMRARIQRENLDPGLSNNSGWVNRFLAEILRNRERDYRAHLDGLGDRDRSLSPEVGIAAWETLLTSITPDPQQPSAEPSSASGSTTAATSSASSGTTSDSTSNTSLARSENPMPYVIDCVSDSGSNTEDEEAGLQTLSRNRARWTTFADMVSSQLRPPPRQTLDDLGGWHRIIAGLTEREDIPDDWWASVGLSRNIPPHRRAEGIVEDYGGPL